jgi:hypothetical protein
MKEVYEVRMHARAGQGAKSGSSRKGSIFSPFLNMALSDAGPRRLRIQRSQTRNCAAMSR